MDVAKGGAYELLEAGSAEGDYEGVVGGGDELVSGSSGCSSRGDKQLWKQERHRPKARMDHCSLMEVLYYALCGIPGGSRGELTKYPMMIRVMEGHEMFGPLQLRRVYWKQEMFKEEEELEQGETGPDTGRCLAVGSLWKWTRRERARRQNQ